MIEEAGNEVIHMINILLNCINQEERTIAVSALSKSFIDFMIYNLQTMSRKENEINSVLCGLLPQNEIASVSNNLFLQRYASGGV